MDGSAAARTVQAPNIPVQDREVVIAVCHLETRHTTLCTVQQQPLGGTGTRIISNNNNLVCLARARSSCGHKQQLQTGVQQLHGTSLAKATGSCNRLQLQIGVPSLKLIMVSNITKQIHLGVTKK